MNNFYVYAYMRSADSKTGLAGTPYYIGKGKDRRSRNRCKSDVQAPVNTEDIVIVAKDLTEGDAFEREIMLIKFFGRVDLGTGCLRNRSDGGDGSSGKSEASRLRISLAMMGNTHGHLSKGTKRSQAQKTHLSLVKTGTSNFITHCRRGHERTSDNTSSRMGTKEVPIRVCLTCRRAKDRLRRPRAA